MSVAFWSCKLAKGKPQEVQPPEGYVLNVQQAALTGEGKAIVKLKTVSIEGDEMEAVVGTLKSGSCDQIALSLVFGFDVPTTFSVECSTKDTAVYLSGYYQPGPDSNDDDDDDDYEGMMGGGDSDSDSGEDSNDDEAPQLKAINNGKNSRVQELESGSDSSGDDDDEEEEKVDEKFVKKMIAKNQIAGKGKPESDEESGDDDSGSEDSEDDEPPVKSTKTAAKGTVTPSGQKSKANTPATKPNNSKPNTPANKGNNKTPNKGKGQKTPQNNQKGGNQQSSDKRKR